MVTLQGTLKCMVTLEVRLVPQEARPCTQSVITNVSGRKRFNILYMLQWRPNNFQTNDFHNFQNLLQSQGPIKIGQKPKHYSFLQKPIIAKGSPKAISLFGTRGNRLNYICHKDIKTSRNSSGGRDNGAGNLKLDGR